MKMKRFALLLLSVFLLLASCSNSKTKTAAEPATFQTPDTSNQVYLFDQSGDFESYFQTRRNELLKKWDPSDSASEIAKLNNTRSNSHLSDETIELLLNCISLSEKTNGKVDITLYPLTRLWGFESDAPKKPEGALVSLLISKCGMDTISVSNNMFTLDQYTMLDPSAVAIGQAVDFITAELSEKGCKYAMFQIGDHVRTLGRNPEQPKWEVLLTDPFDTKNDFAKIMVDGDCSVSTKGAFQCYFVEEGKRYCNIFDPETGNPVDNDLLSATVVCDSGVTADAYATACFILGSEDAEDFYRSSGDFDLILVLKNGEVRVSEGLNKSVKLLDSDQKIKVIKK